MLVVTVTEYATLPGNLNDSDTPSLKHGHAAGTTGSVPSNFNLNN